MNVGIIGKMGSGKTTAANFLVEKHGFVKMGLADPIRSFVINEIGIKGKEDPLYRILAQEIGTDVVRKHKSKAWINNLCRRAEQETRPIIVDDIRFINEAEELSRRGWILVYLKCPYEIRVRRCKARDGHFDESTLNHPSETEVNLIYSCVKNYLPPETWIEIDASQDADTVNKAIEKALFP